MKVLAFRIQNYRAIIDTNWCSLSHDNITVLIGQNESGKTSVLEALHSFYNGIINEDILRSDLTLPMIQCKFELSNETFDHLLNKEKIPPLIRKTLKGKKDFIIARKWESDRSSEIYISDENILECYRDIDSENARIIRELHDEITRLTSSSKKHSVEMDACKQEKQNLIAELKQLTKLNKQSKKKIKKIIVQSDREIAQKEIEQKEKEYEVLSKKYRKCVEKYESLKHNPKEVSEKLSLYQSFENSSQKYNIILKKKSELQSIIRDKEHIIELTTSESKKKSLYKEIRKAKVNLEALQNQYLHAAEDVLYTRAVAACIIDGKSIQEARAEAQRKSDEEKNYYSEHEIAELLFEHIPIFEFFEDFSSLLPNKIDLEDIFNENTHAEGYKAARNFLQLSGLNASFFREKNQRILKQKIENLNGEITINFLDYWSQSISKNNQIKLSFELEHYDYTHPEKSGKPYLEFWIRDREDRLYPKQRSRGVRWFLSFYLELKASAKHNHASRIILIDEPGLSLHARAQEDVLKVFEDLKSCMQIIYCTHSPYLINIHKLYRILAVQRADQENDQSQTLIFDPGSLYAASSDTLSPIYTLIGVNVNQPHLFQKKNNIIVEDTLCYYYLNAFCRLAEVKNIPAFIPSTGMTNITMLSNIMLGWKLQFSVLLFGEFRVKQVKDELKKSFAISGNGEFEKRIIKIDQIEYPEDLLSTLDFKKYVLQQRIGITVKNSEYISSNSLSRDLLASQFLNYCETNHLTFNDLDNESRDNISALIGRIQTGIE